MFFGMIGYGINGIIIPARRVCGNVVKKKGIG